MSKLQLVNDLINKLQKYKFTNDFFKLLITKNYIFTNYLINIHI